MRLFVEYTNWKGVRDLREIKPWEGKFEFKWENYQEFDGPVERTLVLPVEMVDRNGARRCLKVENIHGFKLLPDTFHHPV